MSDRRDDSRDRIFAALESSRVPPAPARPPFVAPPMPSDPEAVLEARLIDNGGRLVRADAAAWCEAVEWPAPLAALEHVFVGHGVDAIAGGDPRCPSSRGAGASARTGRALEPLEVCVVRGAFAVVENGATWVEPRDALERAAALLTRHLVVVVPATALVASLHEAYARLDLAETRFGWFLSGPSKTADIEQAMVFGAHGACSMQLVLLEA